MHYRFPVPSLVCLYWILHIYYREQQHISREPGLTLHSDVTGSAPSSTGSMVLQ